MTGITYREFVRKICYYIFLIAITIALMIPANTAMAKKAFMLNNWKDVEEGSEVDLYKDDLHDGSVALFSIEEPEDVISMEISLDGGDIWNDMNRMGPNYTYRYCPVVDGQRMEVLFKLLKNDGRTDTIDTDATVIYHGNYGG